MTCHYIRQQQPHSSPLESRFKASNLLHWSDLIDQSIYNLVSIVCRELNVTTENRGLRRYSQLV
jgi:hypothetical protein